MAKRSSNGTVTAIVRGDSLVITVPLNADNAYQGQRGTLIYARTPFTKAAGDFNGKGVAFTVTAVESNR